MPQTAAWPWRLLPSWQPSWLGPLKAQGAACSAGAGDNGRRGEGQQRCWRQVGSRTGAVAGSIAWPSCNPALPCTALPCLHRHSSRPLPSVTTLALSPARTLTGLGFLGAGAAGLTGDAALLAAGCSRKRREQRSEEDVSERSLSPQQHSSAPVGYRAVQLSAPVAFSSSCSSTGSHSGLPRTTLLQVQPLLPLPLPYGRSPARGPAQTTRWGWLPWEPETGRPACPKASHLSPLPSAAAAAAPHGQGWARAPAAQLQAQTAGSALKEGWRGGDGNQLAAVSSALCCHQLEPVTPWQ